MSRAVAFVGDVHGNLSAVTGMIALLRSHGQPHMVFLGDLINKGEWSAEVMEELISQSCAGRATLLRGNHESALLDAITTGDLRAFLKMGGAMTIRSYVGGKVGADVFEEFRAQFPAHHLSALTRMRDRFELEDVVAQHVPPVARPPKFAVSAHFFVGDLPLIESGSAQIDTGCGNQSGRLTALLWPGREYLQVDASGAFIR